MWCLVVTGVDGHNATESDIKERFSKSLGQNYTLLTGWTEIKT